MKLGSDEHRRIPPTNKKKKKEICICKSKQVIDVIRSTVCVFFSLSSSPSSS